jgi:Uma2 family endonuclease
VDDYDNADNVFEPDFTIVCTNNQLDEYGCKGAPSLVIEVFSPSTSRNDRIKKYNTYQKFGVFEYWIVDPLNETVEIYVLDDGTYRRGNVYGREDVIKSHQFGDLEVVREDMFSYGE